MFSLKSALTWGIGLALGVSLVASLRPDIRAQVSQAIVKTEAKVESTLRFAEEGSASVSTGSPAQIETGAQSQTGDGVNVSPGNTSATIGTEADTRMRVGAETQSPWSLKSLFYKLTHSYFGLSAEANP
jgi:hypothetical protein